MVNEWLKTIDELRARGARRVRIAADSIEVDFGDALVDAVANLAPEEPEKPETPAERLARLDRTLFASCG